MTFALLAAWTGLIAALWAAFLGLFLGIFVAIGAIAANSVTRQLFNTGAAQAVGALGVVTGALVGAGGAFVAVYSHVIFASPMYVLISVLSGGLLAVLIVAIVSGVEGDVLRWVRGYRHLTKDEARRLSPLLLHACNLMNLTDTPKLAMADLKVPSAWAHMRHVVLTTALLETLTDDELLAVLVHELHHWDQGHSVGLTFVAACGWPVILLYNLAAFIGGYRLEDGETPRPGGNFGAIIVWFLFWPAWLLVKLVIGPAAAARERSHEFEADAAAYYAGLGIPLANALEKLSAFEGGRTGWEAVTAAGHPATALRIDRLRPAQPGDEDYIDVPLGTLSSERFKGFAYLFVIVVVAVIAVGAVLNHVRTSDTALAGYPQTPGGAEQAGVRFTDQFYNDARDPSAVQTLVTQNSSPSATSAIMDEFSKYHDDLNAVIAAGYDPRIHASAIGCNIRMTSGDQDASVGVNEYWVAKVNTGRSPTNDFSTLIYLSWTGTQWQLQGFTTATLGTAGYPDQFGGCP